MKYSLLALSLIFLGVGCLSVGMLGVTPIPGTWSFHLDVSDQYLQGNNCPLAGSGISQSPAGEADVAVTESGAAVSFSLDGQLLVFTRGLSNADYATSSRFFPVRTNDGISFGTVYFDFVANTPDTIIGTLHWDNRQGCVGEYPFTMELIESELPGSPSITPYTPAEGAWQATSQEVTDDCGGDVSSFSNLPSTFNLSYDLDLDTNLPSSSSFTLSPMNTGFERIGGSNIYAQIGHDFDVGLPLASNGDVLLDHADETFTTVSEFEVLSDGNMTGTFYSSSATCQVMMSIEFTSLMPTS